MLARALDLLRDDRGFTLMELLVAIVTGIVVTGALLTILEVSLRQQARINDRAQANQLGRGAMSAIIDRLHSSCAGFGTYPIQGPSSSPTSPLEGTGPVNLWFLSEYGSSTSGAASPSSSGITEHDINWTFKEKSNTGLSLGTLTDYAFTSTGGISPKWTFPELKVANAKATILAKHVVPQTVSATSTLFQYYQYNTNSASATFGQLLGPLAASELPYKQATTEKAQSVANELAKVTIGFTQAPESADTRTDRTASLSDAVVLRFTPTETGTEAVNSPCE